MDVSILAYLISPVQFNLSNSLSNILDWINKFSLPGILIAILTIYHRQRKEKKDKQEEFNERLCRICNTLLIDINNLNVLYGSAEYKADRTKPYSQNLINTASYDSILNSGLITYFQKDTQYQLNSYYFYARVHNKRVYDLAEMFNNTMNSNDLKENDIRKLEASPAWMLNEAELTRYENEIIKALPIVKKLLDAELVRIKK